jgi:hypothetical protein
LLVQEPLYFTPGQQDCLFDALNGAAVEFGYRLTDVSIESWHVHWIVEHGFDPVKVMVGRLKTRMRQALDGGRAWTTGYCHRCFEDQESLLIARAYIARHPGCRMTDAVIVRRPGIGMPPGKARG